MTEIIAVTPETIQSQIFTIRGKYVMMDRDLAVLYSVETKQLKRQVKRNIERFPTSFSFLLTDEELENLRCQSGTSSLEHGGSRYPVLVFTEAGIAMLSAVLRSETAIKISIQIMEAFVEMRKILRDNALVFRRIESLEQKQIVTEIRQLKADENFEKIFDALGSSDLKPKQGIFYDGQVFDAYVFVADLIRVAKRSIVLIDNYVDDTVLSMFTKRNKGVSLTIYTKDISKQLLLDKKKHDQQYDPVTIKQFKHAHDRFLIIDGAEVYHIGASLKDLGLKWFAFSKMEMAASDILKKLI
ncbi:MAG TPA: ORF6N domain-containing protein [Pedobacter sp.]|uniref:ORF6N domain-containing protein n=1 Tax=Pedobacter sp. TaxID=1411316 RepID=UPI002C3281BF|nr:ORF6N domain-containing protein [Pedobacter sp.]HMI01700.1 ORF6N domain-containing protein [Pedobacter sp.]